MTVAASSTAALAGSAACDSADRSPGNCSSRSELTARIGGQVYKIGAADRPVPAAVDGEDIFAPSVQDRDGPQLIYCQRRDRVPVALEHLTLRPPSLGPSVVQLSISDRQRDPVPLPVLGEAANQPWRETPAAYPGTSRSRDYEVGDTGRVIRVTCPGGGERDVDGNPLRLCDTRVALQPGGVLSLKFIPDKDRTEARRILADVDRYLQSLRVGGVR